MITDPERAYTSQIVPFVVSLFTSFLTVRFLYSITNQKSILCILFLLVYVIVSWIRKYIKETLYPEHHHKDSLTTPPQQQQQQKIQPIQRIYLLTFMDILSSILIFILTQIIVDIFYAFIIKVTFRWYDYIVVLSLTIVVALHFILSY